MTRAYQAFRKMSPGTMGGQSRVATPAAPARRVISVGVVRPSGCEASAEITWSADTWGEGWTPGFFDDINETGERPVYVYIQQDS